VQQTASSLINPIQSPFERHLKAMLILISAGKDLSINLIQLSSFNKLNLYCLLFLFFSLSQEQQWIGPNEDVTGAVRRHLT